MSSVVFSRAIEKISEEFAFQMCNTAKRLECPMHTKSGNFSLGKTWPFVFVLTSEKNTWQILQLKFLRTCVSVCACILCIGVSVPVYCVSVCYTTWMIYDLFQSYGYLPCSRWTFLYVRASLFLEALVLVLLFYNPLSLYSPKGFISFLSINEIPIE